ncbi:hypothetical protein [Cellulomonas composti]|uniref:Lipoprotein n=1 Tax=Cellulomonas composti TaxID=266130 RepID=A0A511JAD0_9CELL|nr:hypothetical protein [Cellulomonas composti]GEL94950.1 hypothetical protein CCO02nite_16080 [Cellulomonas composti]
MRKVRLTARPVRWLVVGALAGAATLLSGCAGTPGAAAVVNGDVISSEDVRVAVEQLGALYDEVNTVNVTTVLIQEPILTQVATEHGIGVSEKETVDLLNTRATQAGVDPLDEYAPSTLAVARYALTNSKMQDADDADDLSTEVATRITDADIDVNPRFGEYDPETLQLTAPSAPAWIFVPAASVAE